MTTQYNQTANLYLGTPIICPGENLAVAPASALLPSTTITNGLNRGVAANPNATYPAPDGAIYDWFTAAPYNPGADYAVGGLAATVYAIVNSGSLNSTTQIVLAGAENFSFAANSAYIQPIFGPFFGYNLLNNGTPIPYILWNDTKHVDANGNLLEWTLVEPQQKFANTIEANPSYPLAYLSFTKYQVTNGVATIQNFATIGSRYGNGPLGPYSADYTATLNLSTTNDTSGAARLAPSTASVAITGSVPSYVPQAQQASYTIAENGPLPINDPKICTYSFGNNLYSNLVSLYTYNTTVNSTPYIQEYMSAMNAQVLPYIQS